MKKAGSLLGDPTLFPYSINNNGEGIVPKGTMKRGMKNVMTMVSKALGILLMIELYDKPVRKSRQKQLLYSQILH